MIGLDTNVLLRLILRDDEEQFRRAAAFVESQLSAKNPGYINLMVLVEFAWTLRNRFKMPKDALLDIIDKFSRAENLEMERQAAIAHALWICRSKRIDFADALIATVNRENGCGQTVTFDRALTRSGEASPIP